MGLIDKGAGIRGASTTKKGTRIDIAYSLLGFTHELSSRLNKIIKLQVTSQANLVLSHRIKEFTMERKHPWGCWLAVTLHGLRRMGLGVLAEDGFEQLCKLKAPALRAQKMRSRKVFRGLGSHTHN